MNTKVFISLVLLLVVAGVIGKQCWNCVACPKPFKNNEAGVSKVDVGDNNFCFKFIDPILKTESRGDGGTDCTPVDKQKYCCKGDLCNAATATTSLSFRLLALSASLFLAVRFFY